MLQPRVPNYHAITAVYCALSFQYSRLSIHLYRHHMWHKSAAVENLLQSSYRDWDWLSSFLGGICVEGWREQFESNDTRSNFDESRYTTICVRQDDVLDE